MKGMVLIMIIDAILRIALMAFLLFIIIYYSGKLIGTLIPTGKSKMAEYDNNPMIMRNHKNFVKLSKVYEDVLKIRNCRTMCEFYTDVLQEMIFITYLNNITKSMHNILISWAVLGFTPSDRTCWLLGQIIIMQVLTEFDNGIKETIQELHRVDGLKDIKFTISFLGLDNTLIMDFVEFEMNVLFFHGASEEMYAEGHIFYPYLKYDKDILKRDLRKAADIIDLIECHSLNIADGFKYKKLQDDVYKIMYRSDSNRPYLDLFDLDFDALRHSIEEMEEFVDTKV